MSTTTTSRIVDLIDAHLGTWSEPNADRRLERIRECWEADGALVDPPLEGYGHAGISELMAAMQQHYPGHVFVRAGDVDSHHDSFRVAWQLRGPDGSVALSGMDVGLFSQDYKLVRISGFFGELHSEGTR